MTRHPQSADAPEAKKKRNTTPLSAHDAVGKIRGIYADQEERIAVTTRRIRFEDDQKAQAFAARVEGAEERGAMDAMLKALCICVPAPLSLMEVDVAGVADDEPAAGDVVDDVPSRPSLEEYDARGVMEPLSPERAAVGRKR